MQFLSVSKVSISVDFVRSAITRLPMERAEIEGYLEACRIPPGLLDEPNARVSLQQYALLITRLMVASNDELLGHGHKPLPMGSVSILCHWMIGAETMGQAVSRSTRFYQIMGKGFDISLHHEGELFFIEVGEEFHPRESDVYVYEFIFFFIHRILCWLRKDIFPIDHIYFPFAPPGHARDYRLMFYGAPVTFECKRARIAFSSELLQQPVLQSQETLNQMLADPFTNLLVLNFYGESWSSRVGRRVQELLPTLPNLPQMAEMMNLPAYTLQRRLAEEGVTYLDIKNQVKRDAAIEMLAHSNLSIEEISSRLGFSETSPFTRTFKQWTGVPPSAYRNR